MFVEAEEEPQAICHFSLKRSRRPSLLSCAPGVPCSEMTNIVLVEEYSSGQHTFSSFWRSEHMSLPFISPAAIDFIDPQVFPPVRGTTKSRFGMPLSPSQNAHLVATPSDAEGLGKILASFVFLF
eukprot:scaffold1455_cov94-Skeletonema_marinoi.AAC.1